MIIGMAEGDRTRFEIVLMSDGYIVRARGIDSGEPIAARERMFRTAPAAFAFAELSALEDTEDRAAIQGDEAQEARINSDRAARQFADIRTRLADSGVSAGLLAAWSRQAEVARAPLMN